MCLRTPQSTGWLRIAADSFSVKEEQRDLCSSSLHLSGPQCPHVWDPPLLKFMWKIWYFHVPPCVHLCTPGREMATCTCDTWLPHPPSMPLNNPAKIQGIWAAGMYLCLCASQTRSDVSAGLRSNGRWYFRGTIKQLRSPESNYDFEPATLDFHHPHEASPGEMPTPSPLSMAGLYITLSLDLSSLTFSESSLVEDSPLSAGGVGCDGVGDASVGHMCD